MEERTGAGGLRHFLANLVLAAVLACFAAYGAYLLGIQGPDYLLVGGLVGLVLFVFLQWWEYVAEPVVGSFTGPVKVSWPGYQRPDWAGKKKLRRDTLALTKEIRDWGMKQPNQTVQMMASHQAMATAISAAQDEAERDRIWNEYTLGLTQQSEQERQRVGPFAGRLTYFIAEYKRRKMLTYEEASRLRWQTQTGSLHWLSQAIAELEALAERL